MVCVDYIEGVFWKTISDQRQKLGDLGEEIASNYLKKKGYKILERQYKSQYGEIDIIAEHKKTLVFVEVKARRSDDFGLPEEAVDERKLEKIIATGNCYQQKLKSKFEDVQVDVVSIIINKEFQIKELKHLTDVWL